MPQEKKERSSSYGIRSKNASTQLPDAAAAAAMLPPPPLLPAAAIFLFLALSSPIFCLCLSPSASPLCPPCGNLTVPYPFSTSSSCGHPSYPLSCANNSLLSISTPSGSYPVQSLDRLSRTLIITTPPFIPNTCITQDSLYPGNFSVDPLGPISISPNNTVLVFNASKAFFGRSSSAPALCQSTSPCNRALPVLAPPSCRQAEYLCCSLETSFSVFRQSIIVTGILTGYISIVNLDYTTPPETWHQGLQLAWDEAAEPPCRDQSDCGTMNSTCRNRNNTLRCLCSRGYYWDPTSGTCNRVSFCNRHKSSPSCHRVEYAYGLTLGLLGIIVVLTISVYAYKKRRKARAARAKLVRERSRILACSSGGKSARLFSSKEIKRATKNFCTERVLGSGGFGVVYKGMLDDGTPVAVKCAKTGNALAIDQVLNEVRILSQVNHRSLVRLLGCCVDHDLPLLVYEFIPNGSLYDHLHGGVNRLDWATRLRIALQSAEGLAYLHSAAYPPIYHRDIKSSNILLDEYLDARVADFGLSRLIDPYATHVSTCAQGTLGYLDPEYYRNYKLTDKSDVYSFGVVLLELVTSQKAIDSGRCQEHLSLVVMMQDTEAEGRLVDVLAPEVAKGSSEEVLRSMKSVAYLALHCVSDEREKRPSMKEVAEVLQGIVDHAMEC